MITRIIAGLVRQLGNHTYETQGTNLKIATPSACYRGPKPQKCPKWLGEGTKGKLPRSPLSQGVSSSKAVKEQLCLAVFSAGMSFESDDLPDGKGTNARSRNQSILFSWNCSKHEWVKTHSDTPDSQEPNFGKGVRAEDFHFWSPPPMHWLAPRPLQWIDFPVELFIKALINWMPPPLSMKSTFL